MKKKAMNTSIDSTLSFLAGFIFVVCVLIQFDHIFNLLWVYELLQLVPSFPKISGSMMLGAGIVMMLSYGLAWLPELIRKRQLQRQESDQEVLWNMVAYIMMIIAIVLIVKNTVLIFLKGYFPDNLLPIVLNLYSATGQEQMLIWLLYLASLCFVVGLWALINSIVLANTFYRQTNHSAFAAVVRVGSQAPSAQQLPAKKSAWLQVMAAVFTALYVVSNYAALDVPDIEHAIVCQGAQPCLQPLAFLLLYWFKMVMVCLTFLCILQLIVEQIRKKRQSTAEYQSRILVVVSAAMLVLSSLMVIPVFKSLLMILIESSSFIFAIFFTMLLLKYLVQWFVNGVRALTYVLGSGSRNSFIRWQKARMNLLRLAVILLGLLVLKSVIYPENCLTRRTVRAVADHALNENLVCP